MLLKEGRMPGIKRITVDNEEVALKKSFDGWRVVFPTKDADGTRNWKHTLIGGSYWNILKLLAILGIVLFMLWSYNRDIKECSTIANACIEEPCHWCEVVTAIKINSSRTYDDLGRAMGILDSYKQDYNLSNIYNGNT